MSKHSSTSRSFQKGLNFDDHEDVISKGDYIYGKNLVLRDKDQVGYKSNEIEKKLFAEFDSDIVGSYYLEENDYYIIFLKEGSIYKLDKEGNKKLIISDSEFGCDWNFKDCEYIEAEFKSFGPCAETHVYFSANCEYYTVNIDEMLDEKRKASVKNRIESENNRCADIDCDYFKLFTKECNPVLEVRKISSFNVPTTDPPESETLTHIKSGSYQFCYKLKRRDGAELNFSTPTDAVLIGSEHNITGEPASGRIDLTLEELPCDYDLIEIVVIKNKKIAESLGEFGYSGRRFSYTYAGEKGEAITTNEILKRNLTYINGNNLIQKDSRIFLFGIKQRINADLQRQVNNINVKWLNIEVLASIARRYNLKSVPRGEVKAYGIKYNGTNGQETPVFHIPACGNGPDFDAIPEPDSNYENPYDGDVNKIIQEIQESNEYKEVESDITNDLLEDALNCEDCYEGGSLGEEVSKRKDNRIIEGLDHLREKMLGEDIKESGSITEAINNLRNSIHDEKVKRKEEIKEKEADIRAERESVKRKIAYDNTNTKTGLSTTVSGTHDSSDLDRLDEGYKILDEGYTDFKKEQDIIYPDIRNCEGEYIYGNSLVNQQVCHHQYPWTTDLPHFESDSEGVPSNVTPNESEYDELKVNLLGTRFLNIPLPSEDELGFELCKENPYTIVEVPLDDSNKTILDRGMITNCFRGEWDGKEYMYKSPAVNSFVDVNRYVDRYSALYGEHSRKATGEKNDSQGLYHYNYYSATSSSKKFALTCTHFIPEMTLVGGGYKHSLYEKGKEPDDTFYGERIDRRGTTQSVNLYDYYTKRKSEYQIESKIYTTANNNTTPPPGASVPLMNRSSESSMWFTTKNKLKLNGIHEDHDWSFIGSTLDHHGKIYDARANYGALWRDLENQYGDLHSLQYTVLVEAQEISTSIDTFNNDVYIGGFSFRRTDYISNRFVDNVVIDNKVSPICSPNDGEDEITEFFNDRQLPFHMDREDQYNMLGLHNDLRYDFGSDHITVEGPSLTDREIYERRISDVSSDVYYPGVLKTAITFVGESEVNPYLPILGEEDVGEIVYPFLKEKHIAASGPEPCDPEDAWLDRFYIEHKQPSKWSLTKKSLIMTTIDLLLPAGGLTGIMGIEGAIDGTGAAIVTPILIALWFYAKNVLFNKEKLNRMFGIPVCKPHAEGGSIDDDNVLQFEDNFNHENPDFSTYNTIEIFYPIPNDYYTCVCDNCNEFTTNEVFYSPKQIRESHIDAYKNFKVNNYFNIPADAGSLQNLEVWNNNFYAFTTDGCFVLQYVNQGSDMNLAFLLIGNGELMANPQKIFAGIAEGYAGLQSPKAMEATPAGLLFIDEKANKPYSFTDSFEPLDIKMSTFFNEYLEWCDKPDCNKQHDYAFGYDPELKRVLLTKNDGDKSWTLSYDLSMKRWISFHEYTPDFYLWDRFRMYSINGNKVYKHNDSDTYYSPYIDTVLNEFSWHQVGGLMINTEARENDKTVNKGPTSLAMWNSNQTTGELKTKPIIEKQENNVIERSKDHGNIVDMHLKNGMWRVNELRDNTDDKLIYKEDCHPSYDIPLPNLEHLNQQTYKNRILKDNYHKVRLKFNNFTNTKVYIKSIHLTIDTKQD